MYILCLKITLQRSKLNFDQRLAGKWHDVKNCICPVKFGIADRECAYPKLLLDKRVVIIYGRGAVQIGEVSISAELRDNL